MKCGACKYHRWQEISMSKLELRNKAEGYTDYCLKKNKKEIGSSYKDKSANYLGDAPDWCPLKVR